MGGLEACPKDIKDLKTHEARPACMRVPKCQRMRGRPVRRCGIAEADRLSFETCHMTGGESADRRYDI